MNNNEKVIKTDDSIKDDDNNAQNPDFKYRFFPLIHNVKTL